MMTPHLIGVRGTTDQAHAARVRRRRGRDRGVKGSADIGAARITVEPHGRPDDREGVEVVVQHATRRSPRLVVVWAMNAAGLITSRTMNVRGSSPPSRGPPLAGTVCAYSARA